ncbi:MAG: UvrD-helicase domain-containing protein [Thermoguttaceae bacterium]|jgi:superfamily I DNA/RNA helicase/mRNA-degrading endonuclease RelE of RelBE toxin-antitoxin system|nr:UvrD-helicase domain-containing protein [Thermoguttaceae bacterium]
MSEFGQNNKVAYAITFMKSYGLLPQTISKKTCDTLLELQTNAMTKGLNLEELKGRKYYYSARVDQDYRIILYRRDEVFLFLWVDKHDAAYAWAEKNRICYDEANRVVGVVSITGSVAAAPEPAKPVKPAPPKIPRVFNKIFAKFGREKLAALGVTEDVMNKILGIDTLDELVALKDALTPLTYEALSFLGGNEAYEDVLELYREQLTGAEHEEEGESEESEPEESKPEERKPDAAAAPEEEWDIDEFAKALTDATSRAQFWTPKDEKELRDALYMPLETWRLFLHPAQRKFAERSYNGPVRVLGSAGTGKTVVVVHRAKFLAEEVFTAPEDRILVTTFTRNLANDLEALLKSICSPEAMKRIEVRNISSWAVRYVRKEGYSFNIDYDGKLSEQEWDEAYVLKPDALELSKQFFVDEYALVVQPQNIDTFDQYKIASRVGRGKPLGRKAKEGVWRVISEFRARMIEKKIKTYDELYRDVAIMLADEKNRTFKYRAIVVDEAQDFSFTAYQMLRQMVDEGPNDLFLVGDARQRIYGYQSALSAAGINIRGRGHKLRVNYRTTQQTYEFASRIMSGTEYDDLDGELDPLNACCSLTSGVDPVVVCEKTEAEEQERVVDILRGIRESERSEGRAGDLHNVCVVARRTEIVEKYAKVLDEFAPIRIGADDVSISETTPGVRLASVHRVKGLEFDYIVLVEAKEGVIPLVAALENCDQDDSVAKELAEKKERSLLYVALTRARKAVFVTANGKLSPFLAFTQEKDAEPASEESAA